MCAQVHCNKEGFIKARTVCQDIFAFRLGVCTLCFTALSSIVNHNVFNLFVGTINGPPYYIKDYLSPRHVKEKGLHEILKAMEVADSSCPLAKRPLLEYRWPDTENDFSCSFAKCCGKLCDRDNWWDQIEGKPYSS